AHARRRRDRGRPGMRNDRRRLHHVAACRDAGRRRLLLRLRMPDRLPRQPGRIRYVVVSVGTAAGLVLALASTMLTNLACRREHEPAVGLRVLSMRRPLRSARLVLEDRRWMLGFAMESAGFLLYAAALSLASLTLVQSIAAGGIGVLAFGSARLGHRQLS